MKGEDLELVVEAEGITGLLTEVVVKTRKVEDDVPVVASFPDVSHLLKALHEVKTSNLPLWHVSFSNAVFATQQQEAEIAAKKVIPHWSGNGHLEEPPKLKEKPARALFVYPASREKSVRAALQKIIEADNGKLETDEESKKVSILFNL